MGTWEDDVCSFAESGHLRTPTQLLAHLSRRDPLYRSAQGKRQPEKPGCTRNEPGVIRMAATSTGYAANARPGADLRLGVMENDGKRPVTEGAQGGRLP